MKNKRMAGCQAFLYGRKGRAKGILQVDTDAVESRKALEKWVKLSLDLVLTLPPKVKEVKKKSSK